MTDKEFQRVKVFIGLAKQVRSKGKFRGITVYLETFVPIDSNICWKSFYSLNEFEEFMDKHYRHVQCLNQCYFENLTKRYLDYTRFDFYRFNKSKEQSYRNIIEKL